MKNIHVFSLKDQTIQPKENIANSLLIKTNSTVTTLCTTQIPMQPNNNKLENEGQITERALKQSTTNIPEMKT